MGKPHFHWLCFLTRRCPPPRRTLIVALVCAIYLCFVVSQVGLSRPGQSRRTDEETQRRADAPGSDQLGLGGVVPSSHPVRSNVVYITLRSKRLKPTNIRGTVKTKLRKKVRGSRVDGFTFTHSKLDVSRRDQGQTENQVALETPWRENGNADLESVDITHTFSTDAPSKPRVSAIRMYSQRTPPWLSTEDVAAMRFLADAKLSRVLDVSPSVVMLEGESNVSLGQEGDGPRGAVCRGQCGVIDIAADASEVFAFHLDRVLGLNRTLPTVSRSFNFLQDQRPLPVVWWDASLYPEGLAGGRPTVRLTWGEYQGSLQQRCWNKNIAPKPDSGCSSVHHHEWSKLALFDFLLQIYNRLDQSCCGFRPRLEDTCVKQGRHAGCRQDQDHEQLANIIYRAHDPRHLVFIKNKSFFDRNEDNLDFRLLQGIKEFPEQAVTTLRSRRLRAKLLQSLFIDQTYWESQGGRQGIDKLIDVIERRADVLLTYINAHGIKVVAMNV